MIYDRTKLTAPSAANFVFFILLFCIRQRKAIYVCVIDTESGSNDGSGIGAAAVDVAQYTDY